MSVSHWIKLINDVGSAACVVVLIVMYRRAQLSAFRFLGAFLSLRLITDFGLRYLLYSYVHHKNEPALAATLYTAYFYVYWVGYAIQAAVGICMVYDIYKLAMAPLRGLQRLGLLMFRWAAAIATTVAVGMALGPNMNSSKALMHVVAQLQQTQAILTLCLLLFVCLAIQPMGLSYRSKIFGVSLGLGILAASDLVSSAWMQQSQGIFGAFNLINAVVFCAVLSTWMTYFVVPEPKRRMILLPTTSPFLRWNQISIALGDEPGYVAVGGVHPDIFAPAELEIMRRASVKMKSTP